MSKRILKYQLELADIYVVRMPKGAEILTVQIQRGALMVWALIDMEELETRNYVFEIVGTGNRMEDDRGRFTRKYISTVQQMGGQFIWHIFLRQPI